MFVARPIILRPRARSRRLASNLEEPRPVGKRLPAWRSRSLHRQVRRLLQPPTLSREPEKPHAGRCLLRARATILMKRERIKRDTIQTAACSIKESRLILNRTDELEPPLSNVANCRNAFDDGQASVAGLFTTDILTTPGMTNSPDSLAPYSLRSPSAR